MKISRKKMYFWIIAAAAVGIVCVPYLFSRVASTWRRISVHSSPVGRMAGAGSLGIRVAGYNIAHGRGLATSNWEGGTREERIERLDQIADLLKSLDADVVVLNEVDFDSSWSFSINQARYLAEKAGYPFWIEQRNLDFRVLAWTWRFGNAVLSKYPIPQARSIPLPDYSVIETLLVGKKRGIDCAVEVGGERIRVLGVHLSHRSEAIRARSADMIVNMVTPDGPPTFVVGDLNSTPTGFPHSRSDPVAGNALDIFEASGLFHRNPEQYDKDEGRLTFHAARPKCIIDWILIPQKWGYTDYRVATSTLSDHRPVVADVSQVRLMGLDLQFDVGPLKIDSGMRRVPLTELPPDILRRMNYDKPLIDDSE